MVYALIGSAVAAMLVYDLRPGRLASSPAKVKATYVALLLLAAYHMLIVKGWLRSYSFYDTVTLVFGPRVDSLFAYFNSKG